MTTIDGNGVELGVTEDAFGRTSEQDWSKGGTSIDDLAYGYDADGNVLSKTDNIHSGNSETYGYDNLNRLTSFSRGNGVSGSWDLDAVGNWNSSTTATPSTGSGPATTSRTNNQVNVGK